jgi:hypothetical protein
MHRATTQSSELSIERRSWMRILVGKRLLRSGLEPEFIYFIAVNHVGLTTADALR